MDVSMRFVIVTGMSGAGKTAALKMLEDMKFFCVDNLPIPLLEKFVSLMLEAKGEDVQNAAIGIDSRSGESLENLQGELDRIKEHGYSFEVLYLDADDTTLVKRYKETRRMHPLSTGKRVDEGILLERQLLAEIRKKANYIIDTSRLLTRDLRQELERIFLSNAPFGNMMVTILSFGFKHGIPQDADLVFDARFLPNPYYIDELRPLTGMDDAVFDFVMQHENAMEFSKKLQDLLEFLIPKYASEGKNSLVVAVGCTGGRHRSVSIARDLYANISTLGGYGFRLEHRDAYGDLGMKRHG